MGFLNHFLLFISFTLVLVFIEVRALSPIVHTLGDSSVIERDAPSPSKQTIDIYCYPGVSKSLFALWQTVKFNIRIKNDEFTQYAGNNPEEVFKLYTDDSYGWSSLSLFQRKASRSISLNFFNSTCLAINTKHRHTIELQVIRVHIWRVLLMLAGIAIIFMAKKLSSNPLFFYICGILIGVFASIMLIVYYLSSLVPSKRFLTYGVLIGGWTVGVYILQQMFENMKYIFVTYQSYMIWYALLTSFASFLVCYKMGPPTNTRSKNIVMWILQCVGVLMIFFSSEYKEASSAIIVVSLIIKYFPKSLKNWITGYLRRRFPPKRKLLTNEEYFEESVRETKSALENLRRHCESPDCNQWTIMLRLKDPGRFAKFVTGESHLSDDEVMDYEAYAFDHKNTLPRRNRNSYNNVDASRPRRSHATPSRHASTRGDGDGSPTLEISDDESISDDSDSNERTNRTNI